MSILSLSQYRSMLSYAHELDDLLGYAADTIQPQTIEELAELQLQPAPPMTSGASPLYSPNSAQARNRALSCSH